MQVLPDFLPQPCSQGSNLPATCESQTVTGKETQAP